MEMRYCIFLYIMSFFILNSGAGNLSDSKESESWKSIAPDNKHVEYTGRFQVTDSSVRAFWTGSSLRIAFSGKGLKIRMNKSPNRYSVILDDNEPYAVSTEGDSQSTDTIIEVLPDIEKGEHTVILFKRTEAFCGPMEIYGFMVNGELRSVKDSRTLRMESIGNSITCGYGNEDSIKENTYKESTQNGYMTYSAITARNLNAEYHAVCYSGKGLIQNNQDDESGLVIPDVYDRIDPDDPELKWDFTEWIPDIVTINLGTNDFSYNKPDSAEFIKAYYEFIKRIKSKYPEAAVFCLTGPMLNDSWPEDPETGEPIQSLTLCREYIQSAVERARSKGLNSLYTFNMTQNTPEIGYGADWHPNIKQHRINAQELTSFISEKLGLQDTR